MLEEVEREELSDDCFLVGGARIVVRNEGCGTQKVRCKYASSEASRGSCTDLLVFRTVYQNTHLSDMHEKYW